MAKSPGPRRGDKKHKRTDASLNRWVYVWEAKAKGRSFEDAEAPQAASPSRRAELGVGEGKTEGCALEAGRDAEVGV